MMRTKTTFWIPLFAVVLAGEASATGFTFPPVEASNLEGRELSLPGQLEGNLNLVLIAFQRQQQQMVETWFPAAERFERLYSGFRYYELPTISRRNPLTRWFIHQGMRGGIPDRAARERTITLYLDKSPFREALGLPHEDTVYAVLIDRNGRVLWRASGEFDPEERESLDKAIQEGLFR
jgi:hypothetical protein